MDTPLFGIPNSEMVIVLGILVGFGLLEAMAGYAQRTERSGHDWMMELGSFMLLSVVTKPLLFATTLFLCQTLFPAGNGIFSGWPLVAGVAVFLLVDDFFQYWYHRFAHEYEWLWKLHRSHHQAEEMGFFVSYRNAALYYFLMPNVWWIGVFTFLGGAKAVAIGLILKQAVIISSHSTLTWDSFFYRRPWLSPVMTLLERIFITPAFHHAHHAQTKLDGIGDPNNNFGNMFSFWDQLFGTAVYTRQFPSAYGLVNDPKEPWTAQMLYPIVAADNPRSELARSFEKVSTANAVPQEVHLEKGQAYLWCACGKSQSQPFCDGSHHGSKFKPVRFEARRTGPVRLCNCKLTKSSPFCDDSHIDFVP